MSDRKSDLLHCSFCGLDFERTATACAAGCPIGFRCNHVRCPGCGFEFPEPSRTTRWLARWLPRRRPLSPNGEAVPLARLQSGARCCLARLGCESAGRRNTLTVFGMVPGTELTLLQRHPSYVVRVGETELGLDEEIARDIWVMPLPG